jgi:hypothetical protein
MTLFQNIPFEPIVYDPKYLQLLENLTEYLLVRQQLALLTVINNDVDQCLARIHNGNRCSRKCKINSHEFCGSHIHSLPYGRIDEELKIVEKFIEKKTRGRKSKNKSVVDLDQIDLSQYVKTQLVTINNRGYLLDENGVIFENDSANTIIGLQTATDQYQWF